MVEFTVDGAVYRFRPMSARTLQTLLDDAKAALPDPVDEVLETANKLPEGVKDRFIEKHLDGAFEKKKARGTMGDADTSAWLHGTAGVRRMFQLLMGEQYPHVKADQVDALMDKWQQQEAEKALTESTKVPLTEGEVEERFFPVAGQA